jgi:phospholipase/carboxylesterase
MRRAVWLLLLSGMLAGCPYLPPETRHAHVGVTEPITKGKYWLYVPSYYSEDRQWPLVVTLHGTNPWDGRTRQILEWKDTAERHGLIVVAPQLRSTQGPVPVIPGVWYVDTDDLARDERAILETVEHVCRTHRVDSRHVLLTGFSSGGFPMYHTGLRNPGRFDMLIARDCNNSMKVLKQIELSEEAKKLPVLIFWGKDDLKTIQDQSWQAFRWLREQGCFETNRRQIDGGHLRRPDVAYNAWAPRLPAEYLR